MEYREHKVEDQVEQARAELKTFEQQHSNFTNDETKYGKLIDALERGEFQHWDTRLRTARVDEWRLLRKQAAANRETTEMLIEHAIGRLEELKAQQELTPPALEKTAPRSLIRDRLTGATDE